MKESEIDFWKIKEEALGFKIKNKIYPPRVRVCVDAPVLELRTKLRFHFEGCSSSSDQLDIEILFPLSIKIFGICDKCNNNSRLCIALCYAGPEKYASQSSVTSVRSNMILPPGKYFFVGGIRST